MFISEEYIKEKKGAWDCTEVVNKGAFVQCYGSYEKGLCGAG